MPKYYLDIDVTGASGHQTFSVKARNLEAAKRKFKAHESMEFEEEVLEVKGLVDIGDRDLEEIYQDEPDK